MPDEVKRQYRSVIQRGHARQAVLDAAARLFASQGYVRTSIEEIAQAARVARPTVFAAAGTKAEIFRAIIETAILGDDLGASLADQAWFREVLSEPDPSTMLALHARNIRRIGERVVDLYYAAEMAAASDESIAELWAEVEHGRSEAAAAIATALVQRPGVRTAYDAIAVADVLYSTISPPVYRMLVHDRGWSPDRFEQWAADTLRRILLDGIE